MFDRNTISHTICVNCGREMTWYAYKHTELNAEDGINQIANCCGNPSHYWITVGNYSKNNLHKKHVKNTGM